MLNENTLHVSVTLAPLQYLSWKTFRFQLVSLFNKLTSVRFDDWLTWTFLRACCRCGFQWKDFSWSTNFRRTHISRLHIIEFADTFCFSWRVPDDSRFSTCAVNTCTDSLIISHSLALLHQTSQVMTITNAALINSLIKLEL